MNELAFIGEKLVLGEAAIDYLKKFSGHHILIVCGSKSMFQSGVISKVEGRLKAGRNTYEIFSGINKNPTDEQIMEGLAVMKTARPDMVIALGGGSVIDAAKAMILFYDYPQYDFENVFRSDLSGLVPVTKLVAIPSTSGTASEVTHVSVITMHKTREKLAVKSPAIRPAIAILDPSIPQTMPTDVAAETGMDALTHALEAYINKSGNAFTDALAKEAIEGLIRYLLPSVNEKDPQSREKVHYYQCMAGMAFANSGLGMVHGVSHAFGGIYDMAHGKANAIILPFAMEYNSRDSWVSEKYHILSEALGGNVIEIVKKLQSELGIPRCFCDAGITEQSYVQQRTAIWEYSMGGSTRVNPIPVTKEEMGKFIDCVYYGNEYVWEV